MLYYTTNSKKIYTYQEGENFLFTPVIVESILADGLELELILFHFENSIPRSTAKIQCWFGDIAKSIAFFLYSRNK